MVNHWKLTCYTFQLTQQDWSENKPALVNNQSTSIVATFSFLKFLSITSKPIPTSLKKNTLRLLVSLWAWSSVRTSVFMHPSSLSRFNRILVQSANISFHWILSFSFSASFLLGEVFLSFFETKLGQSF